MSHLLRRQAPCLAVLALSLVYVSLTDANADLSRATSVAVFGLIALSVGIGWGQAGILSLAQAQFAAIGAYATAIAVLRYDWPVGLALLPAVAIPAVVALVLGRVVVRLSPLALAIATLLVARLITVLIQNGDDFTGGFLGLSGVPRVSFATENKSFSLFAWVCVVVVIFLYANLMDSAVGRALQTIRHDPVRADADGINVVQYQAIAFALGGALAGFAGWLYAQFISYVGPESLGVTVAITAVLMAVVGGARSVVGPLIGATILTVAGDYLPSEDARGLFYGGTLVIILMLAPTGITGIVSLARRRGMVPPLQWKLLQGRSREPESVAEEVT